MSLKQYFNDQNSTKYIFHIFNIFFIYYLWIVLSQSIKNNYWNVHVNNINIILFLKETINYNKANKIFILKCYGKNLTIFKMYDEKVEKHWSETMNETEKDVKIFYKMKIM